MLWKKFNLSTVTDRQRETGEAKVRQGDNCDCVPLGLDDQVKEAAKLGLCAAQLGMHNDSQSKIASYVGINPIPRQPIPPPPPPPQRESKHLSIMPFQTLSTKQSEVAEFDITRLKDRFLNQRRWLK